MNFNDQTKKIKTNNKIKRNLSGIKIGFILIILGILTYLVGVIAPPSTENFFAMTSSILMFGGLITLFVIGIKKVFRKKED